MEPAIFISYSREDERHAKHLLALLRKEGYSVWIDQEAIAGASIWSDEIVENIKKSDIFIALLSASSAASHNVGKEIALAAEHGKVILPIEIGSAELPGRLEYALAGIQRTNFNDEDAILHAVRSQVARLEGGGAKVTKSQVRHDAHKKKRRIIVISGALAAICAALLILFHTPSDTVTQSNTVVVLPFSTLNLDQDSTHNLDVFSEAILTRLSTNNDLSTIGASISSSYKDSKLNALAIAKELHARFVIEGVVRKSHDVNYISARVYDTKHGGELWEQFYKGNSRELIPIREKLSGDITDCLRSFINNEKEIAEAENKLAANPNDAAANAQLGLLLIGTDKKRAFDLFNTAIKLDSTNLFYYLDAGIVLSRIHDFERMKEFGRRARLLASKQLELHPDSLGLETVYVMTLDISGKSELAEEKFDSLMKLYPKDIRISYNAACCAAKQGKADKAVEILTNLFTFAPGKRNEVLSDPDFDNVRSSPVYQKLMYGATQQ